MRDASSALPMFVTWGKVCFGRNQGTGELETCMPFSLFLSIIPAKVTYIESFASKNIRVCNEIQRPLLCISLIIATVCLACFRLCRFAGRIPDLKEKGSPHGKLQTCLFSSHAGTVNQVPVFHIAHQTCNFLVQEHFGRSTGAKGCVSVIN